MNDAKSQPKKNKTLPSRELGSSYTSLRTGLTYVTFGQGELYEINPNSRKIRDISGHVAAKNILNKMPEFRCVPSRWVYNLMWRSSIKFKFQYAIEKKQLVQLDPDQIVVWWTNVAGNITALVFVKGDDKPSSSLAFGLTKEGKAIHRQGSSGQRCSLEQLEQKRWKKGRLSDERFAPIRQLLEPDQATDAKAA